MRARQNREITKEDASSTKLIIFLIEGADYKTGIERISGGIISIVSLAEETARLRTVHGAEVVVCTFPDQHLLDKHTLFENNTPVFRYEQMQKYFTEVRQVLVHVPEYLTEFFLNNLVSRKLNWINTRDYCHVNILNQNVTLMPNADCLDKLKSGVDLVTITSAHEKYCTRQFQKKYGVPLHKFGVWISPEKYYFKSYEEKENLMVVSPDFHPAKERVLAKLNEVPKLKVQVIQNLTYEEYRQLISRAKWTLTFGEGLDGYFIEPIFSGAVGFGVFNDIFFTQDFLECKTVYASISELADRIVNDICENNFPERFGTLQKLQFEICAKYYDREQYLKNIERFYEGKYTYV